LPQNSYDRGAIKRLGLETANSQDRSPRKMVPEIVTDALYRQRFEEIKTPEGRVSPRLHNFPVLNSGGGFNLLSGQ